MHRSQQTYVILSLGNSIYNIDFEEVVKNHIESQADVTILYKDMKGMPEREISRFTTLELTRKIELQILSSAVLSKVELASLDVYVMERLCLKVSLNECTCKGRPRFRKGRTCQENGQALEFTDMSIRLY